jgi:hypothetical protein
VDESTVDFVGKTVGGYAGRHEQPGLDFLGHLTCVEETVVVDSERLVRF